MDQQDEIAHLREEIKALQDTVASANKDLHLAESHANEMQERCDTVTAPFPAACNSSSVLPCHSQRASAMQSART